MLSLDMESKKRPELVRFIRTAIQNIVLDPGNINLVFYFWEAIACLTSTAGQQKELEVVLKDLEDKKQCGN